MVELLPVAQSIAKSGGDRQTAGPGSAVAVSPAVQVTNSLGAAMADAMFTFAVTRGGGQVQKTIARTDATGRASCGSWTLGPASGPNTLSAQVTGLAAVSFTAKAAAQSAEVTLSMHSPSDGQIVGEALQVTATVESVHALAGVSASAGGRTVALAFGPDGGSPGRKAWRAMPSLAGQPRCGLDLVVTARDALGHATDAVLGLTLDRVPVVA